MRTANNKSEIRARFPPARRVRFTCDLPMARTMAMGGMLYDTFFFHRAQRSKQSDGGVFRETTKHRSLRLEKR